jgi:hypothetical protein
MYAIMLKSSEKSSLFGHKSSGKNKAVLRL